MSSTPCIQHRDWQFAPNPAVISIWAVLFCCLTDSFHTHSNTPTHPHTHGIWVLHAVNEIWRRSQETDCSFELCSVASNLWHAGKNWKIWKDAEIWLLDVLWVKVCLRARNKEGFKSTWNTFQSRSKVKQRDSKKWNKHLTFSEFWPKLTGVFTWRKKNAKWRHCISLKVQSVTCMWELKF